MDKVEFFDEESKESMQVAEMVRKFSTRTRITVQILEQQDMILHSRS